MRFIHLYIEITLHKHVNRSIKRCNYRNYFLCAIDNEIVKNQVSIRNSVALVLLCYTGLHTTEIL